MCTYFKVKSENKNVKTFFGLFFGNVQRKSTKDNNPIKLENETKEEVKKSKTLLPISAI